MLGLAFAVLIAVLIAGRGLAQGDLTPGHLSVAMLPLYYGALGLVWAVPSAPGAILALPFIVFGEIKGIRNAAYYGIIGALAAALGYMIAAHVLGYARAGSGYSGFVVMPALFGLITGVIYWRFVGRNAGRHTVSSA